MNRCCFHACAIDCEAPIESHGITGAGPGGGGRRVRIRSVFKRFLPRTS